MPLTMWVRTPQETWCRYADNGHHCSLLIFWLEKEDRDCAHRDKWHDLTHFSLDKECSVSEWMNKKIHFEGNIGLQEWWNCWVSFRQQQEAFQATSMLL